MPKVSIITDTDSSLPKEMAAEYNILQVPISIHFDEELSGTDHDITNAQLFKMIDETGKLPTTAAPTPGVFVEYFKCLILIFCQRFESSLFGKKFSKTLKLGFFVNS